MRHQMITGIGCFAKPEKLSRVFRKMVNSYTLGKVEELEWMDGHETDGKILLKALIAGESGGYPQQRSGGGVTTANRKVTGFFLTMRGHSLNVSIFAEGGSRSRERYTTNLDELTRIRRKRLN